VGHVVHVYAHPDGGSIETLRRAIKDANGLQTQYKFEFVQLVNGLTGRRGLVDVIKLEGEMLETAPEPRGLIVCEESFPNGEILVEILPARAYLSTDVKLGQSANDPSLRLFFLYQLIAAALTVGVGLSADANRRMTHRAPIGCLWDWWEDANQRSAAMVAARICPACQYSLRLQGDVSEDLLMAARQMLDYVRRTLLTGSSEVPNKIFVAHGHGQDWRKLFDMLKKWNLPVDSFESQPTAGKLVTARWQEMLNSARVAFAVMTPDDPGATVDVKQARQNVIHEIGLCHARLGIFDTIVLIAEGVEEFSNIAGVIHVRFREGRLREVEDRIRACLVERGILEP
jgi:predicted nucleotide-binding protein